MTPMWVAVVVAFVVASEAATTWMAVRVYRNLRQQARYDLELIGHLRRTMEDLKSRDPQIGEPLELGLLELDRWEAAARRRAGATVVRPWGIRDE